MKIALRKSHAQPEANQTLVVFVSGMDAKKKLSLSRNDKDLASLLQTVAEDGTFSGKRKESVFFRQAKISGYTNVLAVGLGEGKSLSAEDARVATAVAIKVLQSHKAASAVIDLDTLLKGSKDSASLVRGLSESLVLTTYDFNEHKSKKPDDKPAKPEQVFVETKALNKSLEAAFEEGQVLAEATNFARHLGDLASNYLTPEIFAKKIQDASKGTKIKVSVWDVAKLKKEKFHGILGVAKGSEEEPRVIIMEYHGAAKGKKPVCLVGKGLTFDSGGISIKPSAAMDEMRYDMCGAAGVVGATLALARMNAKVNVMTIVATTENMPSGSAIKPGDIIVHRNGKTSEILNTDAEGRVVLSDALTYGSEQKPQAIFDAATLTGAIVVALGNCHTGVFTRDEKLMKRIYAAAETAGEQMWHMPLTDDHVEDIKGVHADISNISHFKGAGSATAAAFLEHFVEAGVPWAHFDIAGTAWNVANRLPYAPKKGASGVMVRTFAELVKSYF